MLSHLELSPFLSAVADRTKRSVINKLKQTQTSYRRVSSWAGAVSTATGDGKKIGRKIATEIGCLKCLQINTGKEIQLILS